MGVSPRTPASRDEFSHGNDGNTDVTDGNQHVKVLPERQRGATCIVFVVIPPFVK